MRRGHLKPRQPISSPCVLICVIDQSRKLCSGCGRTIEEIAGWLSLSESSRRAIMAELPARLAEPRVSGADV